MKRPFRASAAAVVLIGSALLTVPSAFAQSPSPTAPASTAVVIRDALDGLEALTAYEYRSLHTSPYTGTEQLESVMTVVRGPELSVRLQVIDRGEVGYDAITIGREAWTQSMGGPWTVDQGRAGGLGGVEILPLQPRVLRDLDDAGMPLVLVGEAAIDGRSTRHYRGKLPAEADADLSGTLDLWVDSAAGFLVRSEADLLDRRLGFMTGSGEPEPTHEVVEVSRVDDPTLRIDLPDLSPSPAPSPRGDPGLAPTVEAAFARLADHATYRVLLDGRMVGQPSVQRVDVVTAPELRVSSSFLIGDRVVSDLIAVGDTVWTRMQGETAWQLSPEGVACLPAPCTAATFIDLIGKIPGRTGTFELVSDTESLDGRPVLHLRSEAGFEIAPSRPVPGTVDLWIDREGGHLVRMHLDGQGVEADVMVTDLDDPTIVVEPPTPDQIAPSPQFSDLGEIPVGSPEG